MTPLLRIQDLSVDFETESGITHALKSISFHVDRNEIVALVGESGSGKSVTSLSILQLLASPPAKYTSGSIMFTNDENQVDLLGLDKKTLQSIRGNKIAMIFQEPMTSLNPVLTCGDQVTEAILSHKKVRRADAKFTAMEWFDRVKLPDPGAVFDRYPHQLSGGQKQRVMIAMAMCCEPSLLICDEPTTALDVTVQKTILDLIMELQQQSGMGVIFITHDLGVVAEIADRAIVMYEGKIVEEGNIFKLFTQPHHPYTRALLACRPVNHPRGKRLPVVSDFIDPLPESAGPSEQPVTPLKLEREPLALIRIEDLSVHFPSKKNIFGKVKDYVKAVDNISFEVYKGETLGLVGESGCGKTTLGRAMLRLIEPTGGKVFYNGVNLADVKKEEFRKLRKDLQIVFQDPYSSLNPRVTIGSALLEPMKVHGLYSNDKQRKEKVISLLQTVKLEAEHFRRYPHEFSGGQRQRIVIARALALDPSFIVCDESVSALDVSVQAQVLNLLNELKKQLGFTVIFISHDLSVVRYISDRILVMNKGRIEEEGPADEIYYHPQKDYTKKLVASIPKGIVSN